MTRRIGGPVKDGGDGWWEFPATVREVLDGDTARCVLDLGLRTSRTESVRLVGIDAPEKNTDAGKAARAFLVDLLPPGTAVTVFTKKPDKYGRILGEVVLDGRGPVTTLLLEAGHAVAYFGGKR